MRQRWEAIIHRLDLYYDQDWRPVWFQPILGLFVFGAALRLAVSGNLEEPQFELYLGFDFYHVWLVLCLLSPAMSFVAWWMIHRGGRLGVIGRGVRLGGNVGLLTVLLSFHAVSALTAPWAMSESRIFVRYIVAAVMVFALELIFRDLWSIRLLNLAAKKMVRERS